MNALSATRIVKLFKQDFVNHVVRKSTSAAAKLERGRLASSLLTGGTVTAAAVAYYKCAVATECEEYSFDPDDQDFISGYSESERFFQCLEYHRSLLHDYNRRWEEARRAVQEAERQTTDGSSIIPGEKNHAIIWPRKVPKASEIPALELDLVFCLRSPDVSEDGRQCQDMQFRIASFYASQDDLESQRKGYRMIKDLAERGHPDGMCLYGIILNEGRIADVEANPQHAVVWWRRCVDHHRHITGMYELAVAMYTGEGVLENTEFALTMFRKAANLGHAGAAYMLGECLLAGVGAERDRADALEWLVTAAELGHQLARRRVFVVLNQDYEMLDAGRGVSERKAKEAEKWVNASDEEKVRAVNIERRFSVGGGSRNPVILAKRKTIVRESRDDPVGHDETVV